MAGSSDCNNTENCEFTRCIGNYGEFQSYILSSQNVIEKLEETFYETGESSAEFIKITYDLQVSNSSDERGENVYCINQKELFIWSTSPIYFLGPKPLLYQSLLAVNVQENRVTIQLLCLCSNVTGKLLSRLTYLVRK